MAKQTLLWTVVPFGRVPDGQNGAGRLRVSALIAPRLTPEADDEQVLKAFPTFLDWPAEVANAKFGLRVGGSVLDLRPISKPDSTLWQKLFAKDTPVAGFQYKDMSGVNLRSFPVRNILRFLRRHYSQLAVQAASNHPTLLPWRNAHPNLKDMLTDLGTLTGSFVLGDRTVDVAAPGFSRFFGDGPDNSTEAGLRGQVFGRRSVYADDIPSVGAEEGQLPVWFR